MTAGWGSTPPSRRFTYMTAQCPLGCGWWSIPPAVAAHVRNGTCARVPWPEQQQRSVLVARGTRVALLALLPAEVSREPVFSDRAVFPLARDRGIRDEVRQGTVVVSPIPGVVGRRWLEVSAAALDRFGPTAVQACLSPDGFAAMEARVGPLPFVACPACGEWTTARGAAAHRQRNTRCRWLAANGQVVEAMANGWRDPWSLRPEVPTKWEELSHGRWWRFVKVVEFPQWRAVLIDPQQRFGSHR